MITNLTSKAFPDEGFPVDPEEVEKADDDRRKKGLAAGTAVAGTGAGVVAIRHNAIASGVNAAHQRHYERKIARVGANYGYNRGGKAVPDPRASMPKDTAGRTVYSSPEHRRVTRASAEALVRRKHQKIAVLQAKKAKTLMGGNARSKLLIGSTALAVPAIWGGSRQLVKKDVRRRDVDAAIIGGAAGAGGYQEATYALKPLDRRAEKKIAASDTLRAEARAYRKKSGLPSNAVAGDPHWRPYFRNYPKHLPGGRLKRATAISHTGKTGVALTAGAGLAGAAGLAHLSQKHRQQQGVAKSSSQVFPGRNPATDQMRAWEVHKGMPDQADLHAPAAARKARPLPRPNRIPVTRKGRRG